MRSTAGPCLLVVAAACAPQSPPPAAPAAPGGAPRPAPSSGVALIAADSLAPPAPAPDPQPIAADSAPPAGAGAAIAAVPGAWTIETNPSPGFDLPSGLAVTADALYASGYEGVGGAWRVERRRLEDGALVWERRSAPGTYWGARDLAASGEELFVAGDSRVEKRATRDGALVPGFGAGGQLTVGVRDGAAIDERIHAIAIDARAVYLVGEGDGGFWIQKRDRETGALVAAFGQGGTWRLDPSAHPGGRSPGSNYLLAGGLAPGALIVGGFQVAGGERGRLLRLDPARGRLDPGFGPPGTAGVIAGAGDVQTVEALAIHGESLFVLVSDVRRGGGSRWLVQRRALRDGRVAWTADVDPGPGHDPAAGLAADRGGIVVVGARGDQQWLIHELTLDGRAAATTLRDPGPGRDEATAVALDARWLYVAGLATRAGQDTAWRIERIARAAAAPRPAQPIAR